ncbi:MAG: hypothetical protein ACXWLH_05835, partial [Candidatus Saccharimonadales bacterium]
MKKNQRGFGHLLMFVLILVVVAVVALVGWRVASKQKNTNSSPSAILKSSGSADDKAVKAGRMLSNNNCKGSGETTFTHLPMNPSDFGMLIPYGLTVGGHVTPIDHQYFTPANQQSAKDAYPVYAMADAQITDIEVHPPENGSKGRIRLVFTVSCTFFYYYDLVTSVQPGISKDKLPIPVKAGQLIGHIGGQTLDFAVWNTKKPLNGFANPASYDAEAWKIYTADPFPYYSSNLRKIVEAKDPRTVEPIAGKIDYDIDGKLIGNWFLKGSGGYHDYHNQNQAYWAGHLSIAPDLYDPSATVVSVGNYLAWPKSGPNLDTSTGDGSDARQYFAKAGSPDPATIGTNSGTVKFELVQRLYNTAAGCSWNQSNYTKNPKAANSSRVLGTILVQ